MNPRIISLLLLFLPGLKGSDFSPTKSILKQRIIGYTQLTTGALLTSLGLVGDGFAINDLWQKNHPLSANHPLVYGAIYTLVSISAYQFLVKPGLERLKKANPEWFKNLSITLPGSSL